MKNLLTGIEEVLLMGPGPSCLPDEVYDAMRCRTLGHMDPAFIEIMDGIQEKLRTVMKTEHRLTLPISGTGSAGMEAAFVNLVEPGDRVLVLVNGVFGKRMQDVAERLGAEVSILEFEWGKPVDVRLLKEELRDRDYKIVAVVHAETSTGVKNPVDEIGEVVKEREPLFLVDAVTSLGGMEVSTDEWHVDALYSGSQKCLSCPPGLAPLTFSERAVETIRNRKRKVPNWYLDMNMIMDYWGGKKRVYHHTAPVNMLYALYQALTLILEEGTAGVFERHRQAHLKLVEGLAELDITLAVDPPYRLPMLNAVSIPEGCEDAAVRSGLRKTYRIEIGGGLGPLAGKIWRIGLMGHTAREENVTRFLSALKELLKR
jgi:alanine-glyoxylate transaminase/serine-glyoxylate transaminase/serine-pyruvate transaminase